MGAPGSGGWRVTLVIAPSCHPQRLPGALGQRPGGVSLGFCSLGLFPYYTSSKAGHKFAS